MWRRDFGFNGEQPIGLVLFGSPAVCLSSFCLLCQIARAPKCVLFFHSPIEPLERTCIGINIRFVQVNLPAACLFPSMTSPFILAPERNKIKKRSMQMVLRKVNSVVPEIGALALHLGTCFWTPSRISFFSPYCLLICILLFC